MPGVHKHIPCLIFFILSSIMMHGQALSSLGKAAEITNGTLPNGISYYLVKNSVQKGYADFALVQQGTPDVQTARKAIAQAPHFGTRKPDRFLAENGVGYNEKGFISYFDESSRFDFRNVPVYDQAVADSTLMLLFDIADTCPSSQAVVVSGDIDPGFILERIRMFSMMVARREQPSLSTYTWKPKDDVTFCVTRNASSSVGVINLIYSTERIARENLDTAVPVVMNMYSTELGAILEKRFTVAFRNAGVPLADFRYSYTDSAAGPEDERYRISIYTSASRLDEATEIVASVLGSLDRNGASLEEFQGAKDRIISGITRLKQIHRPTNVSYVDKCVSAYLYGTTLASDDTLMDFVTRKRLSDDRELDLFNGFAKAMLDSARNLTLRFDMPMSAAGEDRLLPLFNSSWSKDMPASWLAESVVKSDTLSLFKPVLKTKQRSDAAEPISGGKIWTFANGIKVVFKKVPGSSDFKYGMMLRGGYADVPDLRNGENAYVADLLSNSCFVGLKGQDFHKMLLENGITMDENVSLSDLRITGSAPSDKVQFLLQALLSVAHERKPDTGNFEYWREIEKLRTDMKSLAPRDVNSMMDAIICPDYRYLESRDASGIGTDFAERAERYFLRQFSKVNDGVIVLVGDLEEDALKKLLCRMLGDFRTQPRFAPRPGISKNMITGYANRVSEASLGTVGGGELGASLVLSADMPFTLQNQMSLKIARAALEKQLADMLSPYGVFATVKEKIEMFPVERVSMYINIRPCYADGLPEGISPSDPMTIPEAVREFLNSLKGMEPSAADVNAWKAALMVDMDAYMARSESVVNNVLTRFGEGKDVVAGYKNAVSAVSAASVKSIISALSDGSRVEYVVL